MGDNFYGSVAEYGCVAPNLVESEQQDLTPPPPQVKQQ